MFRVYISLKPCIELRYFRAATMTENESSFIPFFSSSFFRNDDDAAKHSDFMRGSRWVNNQIDNFIYLQWLWCISCNFKYIFSAEWSGRACIDFLVAHQLNGIELQFKSCNTHNESNGVMCEYRATFRSKFDFVPILFLLAHCFQIIEQQKTAKFIAI